MPTSETAEQTTVGGVDMQRRETSAQTDPGRLQRWYASLMRAYRDWLGDEAADAFDKAVKAWPGRIDVVFENGLTASMSRLRSDPSSPKPTTILIQPAQSPEVSASEMTAEEYTTPMLPAPREGFSSIARLPSPRPLSEAISAGTFGMDEDGRPLNPSPAKIHEITVQLADALIDLIVQAQRADSARRQQLKEQYLSGIATYSSSFGQHAAGQLDAYIRHRARSLHVTPVWRSQHSEVER